MNSIKKSTLFHQFINKYSKVFLCLESFFATWAIMKIGNLHSMDILALFFFLLTYTFFSTLKREFHTPNTHDHRLQIVISCILAALFTLFYLSNTHETLVSDLDK